MSVTLTIQGEVISTDPSWVRVVQGVDVDASRLLIELDSHAVEPIDVQAVAGWQGQEFVLSIEEDAGAVEYTGRVVSIEWSAQSIRVAGAGGSVALDGAVRTRAWRDMSIDAVLQELLPAPHELVGAGGDARPFIVQYGETDLAFARRLSARAGYIAFDAEQGLRVLAEPPASDALELGADVLPEGPGLVRLSTRPLGLSGVATPLDGPDARVTTTVAADAVAPAHDLAAAAVDASTALFPGDPSLVHTRHAEAADDLHAELEAAERSAHADLVVLECTTTDPRARVGRRILAVDHPADLGELIVTHVEGRYTRGEVFQARISAVPTEAFRSTAAPAPLTASRERAVVLDVEDPDELGRVALGFRWAPDVGVWARVLTPWAGADHGMFALPRVGDEVLVSFENADPEQPYVIGSLFHRGAPPTVETPNGANEVVLLRTTTGCEVRYVEGDDGHELRIATQAGDNRILLDSRDGGRMEIHSAGPCSVTASDIEITAQQALRLAGQSVSIEAEQSLTLGAQSVEVQAAQNLTVESGANSSLRAGAEMKVSGTATSVAADATLKLDGLPVQINC